MEINLTHQDMTDEEIYQNLKKNKNPSLMDADKWKGLRKQELKKKGLVWSNHTKT